jgi:alginate O-acetyltransferase complex protein AlgI
MSLAQILMFCGVALLAGSVHRPGWRGWILYVTSLLAIFWMQPSTPIRNLDFWLPTLTTLLTIFVWAGTQPLSQENIRTNLPAAIVLVALIMLIGLTRYLGPVCCLIPSRPPEFTWILLAFAVAGILLAAFWRWSLESRLPANLILLLILALFLAIKTPFLAQQTSAVLRTVSGQQVGLASALDIRWLGFSYVAFRLIHSLRDRLAGKLPGLSLQEFILYIILFPTFTAGPIDRVQHFSQELHREARLTSSNFIEGGRRIVWGVFVKFVLADSLAIIALNYPNSIQTTSGRWIWILLYAYSFRLFFDFSGYTDIAIGLGMLMGIRLPENFDKPYLKQNLTSFWNAWHITLAQWFRSYFFNPVTRYLRSSQSHLPLPLIIFIGQMGTMLMIGLWHGVTWNCAAWGVWHGIGLFIHKRWADALRPRLAFFEAHPALQKGLGAAGTLLTFHYVTLGWVWFALPTPLLSWQVFARLFNA